MKVCQNCTLNDRVFSVFINDDGLCNYCLHQRRNDTSNIEFTNTDKYLAEAFDKYSSRSYQVILAYSGGKDSTFTLCKLKEKFIVSVLAVTFDNGFITEQCRRNIHVVTASLGVDSIMIKPSFSSLARIFNLAATKEIYPKKSLERASSICTACIGIVKSIVYKEAMLRNIPFVCFGWTPGQVHLKFPIIKLDYRMILANQKQIQNPIVKNLGDDYKKYFIDPSWIEQHKEDIPYLAYPLALSNYNEKDILNTINAIGWKKPQDTDMNSTNCLLNSYANFLHVKEYGFNPYSLEIAALVRNGFMSREDGLEKLSVSGNNLVIEYVKNELNEYL